MKISVFLAIIVIIALAGVAIVLSNGFNNGGEDAETYTVSFDSDGGTTVASKIIAAGDRISEPTVLKEGYEFEGWWTSLDGGSEFDFSKPVHSNITLYARWTPASSKTIMVTWADYDGTVLKTESVTVGSVPEYSGNTPMRADDASASYSFSGWSPAVSAVTEDVTYTATYAKAAKTYDVTFYTDGGSMVKSQKVKYGDTATKPSDPTKTDCTFAGWHIGSSNGPLFDFRTKITESMVLYAQWTPVPIATYTVFFDACNGTPIAKQTVQSGKQATIPSDPVKTGFSFLGWFTSVSGGLQFDFSTPITADVRLYAHWAEEDDSDFEFVIETVNAKPGNKDVKVNIIITRNNGFTQFMPSIEFDSRLTYVTTEAGALGGLTPPGNSSSPLSPIIDAGITDSTFIGTVMTLVFDVDQGASGTLPIRVTAVDLINQDADDVPYSFVDGGITLD